MKTKLLLIAFLVCLNAFAQEYFPGGVPGHTLWLQAEPSTDAKNPEKALLTHFNFNPMLDFKKLDKKRFRNVVNEKFSLFVVFKSDTEEELPVLTINKGKETLYLTNKVLLSNQEVEYKKVDSKKGIILSYLAGSSKKAGKRHNNITLEDFYAGDDQGKQQLLEVIYYPKILNSLERQKVETYLSLKYGLSLVGEADYINSASDTIWNAKKNILFNNRVTGIGRDDALNLYQKQSGNAEKDGLYIGFGVIDTTNAHNNYVLEDKTYLLWGDNAGVTTFIPEKESEIKVMKRSWKLHAAVAAFQDSLTTEVRISKKEMPSVIIDNPEGKDEEYLWLAVNETPTEKFDYTAAAYYRQSATDSSFTRFDTIVWDQDRNGSAAFTFVKGPDFFIQHEAGIADCETPSSGTLRVAIAGGHAPYTLSLTGNVNKILTISERYYEFTGLPSGEYTISVSESGGKKQSGSFTLTSFADVDLSLAALWYLDKNGEAVITPSKVLASPLTCQWYKNDEVLSESPQLTAKQTGFYILKVSNGQGCTKEIPFKVEELPDHLLSGWKLYPNPAKRGEPFTIAYNLEKESNVSIRINSMEGKQISTTNLGRIKDYQHTDSISTSGIYLITITTGDAAETLKLIVK